MKKHSQEKLYQLYELRKKGHSIQELMKILSMPKATVWHHVQKIKLSPKYASILKSKQGGSKNKSSAQWNKAKVRAKEIIGKLDKIHRILIATALYWGEGSKRDLSLSNTDPQMIKTFISCLKEFGVKKENMRVYIRIYEDIDKDKAVKFWEKITGSAVRSVDVLQGKKKGKLLYGMCRLRVAKGGFLLKLLHTIKEEVIKNV
ncbi:MAG: hypothetical protein AAB606_03405 [Patescibacteria group bacterium]